MLGSQPEWLSTTSFEGFFSDSTLQFWWSMLTLLSLSSSPSFFLQHFSKATKIHLGHLQMQVTRNITTMPQTTKTITIMMIHILSQAQSLKPQPDVEVPLAGDQVVTSSSVIIAAIKPSHTFQICRIFITHKNRKSESSTQLC